MKDIININPYSLNKYKKTTLLNSYLSDLTKHHYANCKEYSNIIDSISFDINSFSNYSEIPFLPVRLFKSHDLLSIDKDEVIKTMTSSGTSGQNVSRIFLNKNTALNQTKILTKIVSSFLGQSRMPMIIIDSESVLKDRNLFSARGAGILGFSMFGSKRIYALKENMELNINLIIDFIEQHKNQKIFLFGFTYMIWLHFYKQISKKGIKLDLSNAVLIHGGGWKKLVNESISSNDFKLRLKDICRISSVHDYYGMVEQTGSIYMECEYGHLHTSIFSDVIIRKPFDFSIAKNGEKGIIQTLSILPESYPGHSLLTDDEGVILGEDDCKCGRLGKYFKINGRLKNAEIRGCSDTYEEKN